MRGGWGFSHPMAVIVREAVDFIIAKYQPRKSRRLRKPADPAC